MSLFTPPVDVTFTSEELEVITRPIVGEGGHQRLLKVINLRLAHAGQQSLQFEDAELLHVARYAYSYGNGGYQDRFKEILKAARRAGWSQVTQTRDEVRRP